MVFFALTLALNFFFAPCFASGEDTDSLLHRIESLQKENQHQADVIQAFEASASRAASRRLATTSNSQACFDFKYDGGCTGSSTAFCTKIFAMVKVGSNDVKARYGKASNNCGLSFTKTWKNSDEKITYGAELCALIPGCTHFGINDDDKNKPGDLVSDTIGYFEFSDGAAKCDTSKHSNMAYKTYAMKKCAVLPPKPKPSINLNEYKGVNINNDKAIVTLGKKKDVLLARTGDSMASLYGSLTLVDDAIAEKALTVNGMITARGGVKFGANTGTCDKSRVGIIRYNEDKDSLEFCSGKTAAWTAFASGTPKADGKTAASAGNSCRSIKAKFPSSPSGQYWAKPDRWNGAAFKVYCDMTTGPGGWTLVSQGFGGPMPTVDWRTNKPYNEVKCENIQPWTTASGTICKLPATKINALISNDKTGRYRSFVPAPNQAPANRNTYSLGTCKYSYDVGLNYAAGTNMDNNPCMWSSDKFDMSSPQMQPHRGTRGFEHYKYLGTNGRGFALHYGTDAVRWWLVDGHHHGDVRTTKLNFVLWVY